MTLAQFQRAAAKAKWAKLTKAQRSDIGRARARKRWDKKQPAQALN